MVLFLFVILQKDFSLFFNSLRPNNLPNKFYWNPFDQLCGVENFVLLMFLIKAKTPAMAALVYKTCEINKILIVTQRLYLAGTVIVFQQFFTASPLKGLSHEIDFKNFDKNLQNSA